MHIPNVRRLNLASENPAFLNIPTISSPCGNDSMVLIRYLYAFLSFDISLPYRGSRVCEYIQKSCFMGKCSGLLNSRILTWPPFFNTRHISFRHASRFWKFLIPKAVVIASKLLSLNDRCSQSSFQMISHFRVLPF